MAVPFTARIVKKTFKTITFDGTSGAGAVGTVALATITGGVRIESMSCLCTTLLASAGGGTLECGTASNTAGLIAQTTATDIDADDFWQDASPEVRISPAIKDQLIANDLILTVGTGDITAGVLVFCFEWVPVTTDGKLS